MTWIAQPRFGGWNVSVQAREDHVMAPLDLDAALILVLRELQSGEVVSYGDVADDAGFAGRARAVGRLLATTVEQLPWWRVVNAAGRLVPGNEREQAQRLRAEGVTVRDGYVVRSPLGRFSPRTQIGR